MDKVTLTCLHPATLSNIWTHFSSLCVAFSLLNTALLELCGYQTYKITQILPSSLKSQHQFFLSPCPLQANVTLTSKLLALKAIMRWRHILFHQHFCVCVSQSKQPLVYSEHARTGLLEELGQALCRLKFRLHVHDCWSLPVSWPGKEGEEETALVSWTHNEKWGKEGCCEKESHKGDFFDLTGPRDARLPSKTSGIRANAVPAYPIGPWYRISAWVTGRTGVICCLLDALLTPTGAVFLGFTMVISRFLGWWELGQCISRCHCFFSLTFAGGDQSLPKYLEHLTLCPILTSSPGPHCFLSGLCQWSGLWCLYCTSPTCFPSWNHNYLSKKKLNISLLYARHPSEGIHFLSDKVPTP